MLGNDCAQHSTVYSVVCTEGTAGNIACSQGPHAEDHQTKFRMCMQLHIAAIKLPMPALGDHSTYSPSGVSACVKTVDAGAGKV